MTYPLACLALSLIAGAAAGALVSLWVTRRCGPSLTERELRATLKAFDHTRREAAHAREVAQGAAFTARMASKRGARS